MRGASVTRAKVKAGGVIRESLDNTWQTPPEIIERARVYFGGEIPFDPATAQDNPTRARLYCAGPTGRLFAPSEGTQAERLAGSNGLEVDWPAPTWVNPPYGENLSAWFTNIQREAFREVEILAFLPCSSRWENAWFLPGLASADALCFHRRRVAFISSKDGTPVDMNPGANVFAGWNVNVARFREAFAPFTRKGEGERFYRLVPLATSSRARPEGACGRCGLCDLARFIAWRARIEAGLGDSTDEGSPRLALISEIHADVARRYPLGIATRLAAVIASLAYPENEDTDTDAVRDLADLEQDESESVRLNGAEKLGCCPRSVELFNAGAPL